MSSVYQNYQQIREGMEQACRQAGRPVESVCLEAVSKYVSPERLEEAVEAGVRLFGENHAQELVQKQTFFENNDASVHFIGQLQTNKIKYVCGRVRVIESLDRLSLAEALEKKAEALGICQDVLLQVNIGLEAQKGGVTPDGLEEFCDEVTRLKSLRIRGFMCVPPAGTAQETRKYFSSMYTLFEKMRTSRPALTIDTLSMGMSHDYQAAILEGSTMVRIGTALFGQRDKK